MENNVVDQKVVQGKLKAFKKIVNDCTKLISSGFPWFKFKTNPTISSVGGVQKVTYNKDGVPVCNIDFSTKEVLTKNSAELTNEVYSRLYNAALQWKSGLKNNEKNKEEKKVVADNKVLNLEGKTLLNKDDTAVTRKRAKEIIAASIQKLLENNYKGKLKKSLLHGDEYAAVANAIADRVLTRIDEQRGVDFTAKDIVKTFFDMSKLDEINKQEVSEAFGDVVVSSRLSFISNKVDELSMVPGKELVALGYAQQYEALKSKQLAEQFQNLKINDIHAVKKYCESIANRIMSKAGLNDIKITYKDEGALGQYVDMGYGNHSLNINLSRINSISELTMTITHELTHATDSAVNQVNAKLGIGQINEKTGTGLINNIQESVAGSGMSVGSEGYSYLLRLKNCCYHVNPNERHARQNELASLMFMVENLGGAPGTKNEIVKSIKAYINYQNKTIEMCRPEKISSMENEFNRLKDKGALTHRAVSMIEQRLNYLKQLQQGGFFDASADQETMLEADKLYTKLTGKSLINRNIQNQNAIDVATGKTAQKLSSSVKEM